ncbi:hypothetical protein BHE74_00046636 [Ensete ventricosum]|nr:hypothetical protein BHE74_00046636 [Ensete ventricosum]RZS09305.1 hypothetical protein BHM03_00040376 [Ensete ventricosum]
MLLLWFPYNGIRAKLFVQKIGFKLSVTRLNHVELFYIFLLHFCSKDYKEGGSHLRAGPLQGRPRTIKPPARVVGCGLGPCSGSCTGPGSLPAAKPRPCYLQGRPTTIGAACGYDAYPLWGRLSRAVAPSCPLGVPIEGSDTRPLARAATPTLGAVAYGQDNCRRRVAPSLRRGGAAAKG